jgi:hypothetical protein
VSITSNNSRCHPQLSNQKPNINPRRNTVRRTGWLRVRLRQQRLDLRRHRLRVHSRSPTGNNHALTIDQELLRSHTCRTHTLKERTVRRGLRFHLKVPLDVRCRNWAPRDPINNRHLRCNGRTGILKQARHDSQCSMTRSKQPPKATQQDRTCLQVWEDGVHVGQAIHFRLLEDGKAWNVATTGACILQTVENFLWVPRRGHFPVCGTTKSCFSRDFKQLRTSLSPGS